MRVYLYFFWYFHFFLSIFLFLFFFCISGFYFGRAHSIHTGLVKGAQREIGFPLPCSPVAAAACGASVAHWACAVDRHVRQERRARTAHNLGAASGTGGAWCRRTGSYGRDARPRRGDAARARRLTGGRRCAPHGRPSGGNAGVGGGSTVSRRRRSLGVAAAGSHKGLGGSTATAHHGGSAVVAVHDARIE